MAYIDNISFNGSNYDLRDSGAVRYDESQTLSTAEKLQARSNIDAITATPTSGNVVDKISVNGTNYDIQDTHATQEIVDLKSALILYTGNDPIAYTNVFEFFDTGGQTVDINSPIASTTFDAAVVPCIEGDKFVINGTGDAEARAWVFAGANGSILIKAQPFTNEADHLITAPPGSAYLIINNRKSTTPDAVSYYGEFVKDSLKLSVANAEAIETLENGVYVKNIAKNIFTSEGAVAGKYLSANYGLPVDNAKYSYTDYIPVLQSTEYVVSTPDASSFDFFVATYDKDKNLISSIYYHTDTARTFTTEAFAEYIRFSWKTAYNIQIEKGSVATTYEEHYETTNTIKSPIFDFIVGANEKYKTISSAVSLATDGNSIYVKKGTYNESVNCKGKTIRLVGESKDDVIVQLDDNDYTNPPLNFSSGTVENMTFIQTGTQAPSETGNMYNAYACHIDFSSMAGKTLVFRNCHFESTKNSGVGMGGWNGSKVFFYDCVFVTHSTSNQDGAIFMHNNAYTASIDEFSFKDCVFIANEGAMCIKAQAFDTEGNHTKVTFINNSSSHDSHWLSNVRTATVYQWSDLWNYELVNTSFGNKIAICNSTVVSVHN